MIFLNNSDIIAALKKDFPHIVPMPIEPVNSDENIIQKMFDWCITEFGECAIGTQKKKMLTWSYDNSKLWDYMNCMFYFKNQESAIFFKLTWQ